MPAAAAIENLKERYPNINLADANFLRWHEMTNAIPHSHMVEFGKILEKTIRTYKERVGVDKLTPEETVSCFLKTSSKLAMKCSNAQFNTLMTDDDDE